MAGTMKKHIRVKVLFTPARENTIIKFRTIRAANFLVSRYKAPISRLLPHNMATSSVKKGNTAMSTAKAEVHKANFTNRVK